MNNQLPEVIAGKTGLLAGVLARERIRNIFLATGAQHLMANSRALDESSRREMEALTGYDLSGARINNTYQAGNLARSIEADAFTLGRHIFAPAEKIDTTFNKGRGLLAHELTHVIQQTSPARAITHAQTGETESSADGQEAPEKTIPENHQALPLVQMSRLTSGVTGSDASQSELERQAVRSESAAREPGRERQPREELDKDVLADMVYRLMQSELIIHQDRRR